MAFEPVTDEARRAIEARAAWSAVSAAFAAFGRAFICADAQFRVIHGSYALDTMFGDGAAAAVEGRSLEDVLGKELFGETGGIRQALLSGERREGWRAHVRLGDGEPRVVSLSAAPFPANPQVTCDMRVRYLVILRPAEQESSSLGAPVSMGGLIARSAAMSRVFTLIENLKHTEATILITGESGTGKELVARAIHDQSPRRKGPFVAVNCGALPLELLESEMFGHVRGAFTGAVRDRIGRFEMASEGTLLLDEVGDLPLPLQVKLLRVLQDGTFQRVGDNHTHVSHARVVAATHVDLVRAVKEGRFRDDLFYRLRVVPIEIAPLRERREDIQPLARVILARVGARHGRAPRFSPDALGMLLAHDWPGNVRELENVIEYAVTVGRGQTILPEDLPKLSLLDPVESARMPPAAAMHSAVTDTHRVAAPTDGEIAALRKVLDAHHWRRSEAAKALGISRITLWRRMRAAGLV